MRLNSRIKTAAVLGFSFFCLASLVLPAAAPQDPLWRKAVAIAETNADWIPGLVVTRSEVLHKGKVEGVHEVWLRSRPGKSGGVITETIKILEDGQDITEKEKANNKEKTAAKKSDGRSGANPFDPEVQDRLTLKLADRSRSIDGRNCAGYLFELRNTNGPALKGTAWLEKETGIPVEMENMTLEPLPDKHLKRLILTTRYETGTNGHWHAKTMVTDGTASLMLIKAEFRTITTFSEHWKKPGHEKILQKIEK